MLITLQSNADTDATDFFNHFKETVDILPNSEVALVSMSYNYESSITVDAGNQNFSLALGADPLTALVLTPGSYTPAAFLAMFQAVITAYLAGRPYEYQKAFDVEVRESADGILTLSLHYNPEDWDELKADKNGTADREKIALDNADMMVDDSPGIITQSDTTGGLNRRSWHAGLAGTPYPLWGSAADTGAARPHGYYRWKVQQSNAAMIVALGDGVVPADITSQEAAIQWRFADDGTFQIYEINALGAAQAILTAARAYNAFDTFEIRIDSEPTAPGENAVARYFQNSVEIVVPVTATRWEYRETSKLIPIGSFNSPRVQPQISTRTDTYFHANALTNFTLANPLASGTGFLIGEVVSITGDTSTRECFARVNAITGAKGLLTAQITQHVGGFTAAEALTITGKVSGSTATAINAVIVATTNQLSIPGTGYTAANASITLEDGTVIADAIQIISVNAGAITDFRWLKLLSNTTISTAPANNTLTVTQGGSNNDARITILAIDNDFPSVADVSYSVAASGVDEPLMRQSNAEFRSTAGFTQLTGMQSRAADADRALEIVGHAPTAGREAEQMLVNIDQFQIKSICKTGGIQKAVAAVPYGPVENPSGQPPQAGFFFYEAFNILYHDLSNSHTENHNQLRVRMTDALGNPLQQLKHPTTVTLDIRPRVR